MLKRRALLVAVLGSVFSLCPLLYSQASGSLSGTVADKSGSVISGATVKIISQGTGTTREVKTDGSGHYIAPFLAVSIYTIRVESQGFQTTEQKDIRLQVDEQREVNFALNPASVSQTVEVSATEVAVETTNPTLGQVITSEQVADLPLNGRNFVQLATITPGVTQETNTGSFFNGGPSSEVSTRGSYSLSVGGSRASSTDWLLDGVDNNELTGGGIAVVPSIDAIQEFKVLTYNYSAEYGTRAGPTVLVTTKSGTNRWHGSLFEFFRNTKLDSKSFFASTKEQFNLNQFGGSVGGAIQKDKTFFFLDYQAKRQRRGIPSVGVVPTPDMVGGDFTNDPLGVARPKTFDGTTNADGFADLINPYTGGSFQCDPSTGNALPAGPGGTQAGGVSCNKILTTGAGAMADPTGLQMIQLYPAANVTGNPGFNYSNVPVRKLNEGEFDVRLDHNFSSKDSVFARFSYDQADSFIPGGSPGFAEANAFASTQNISNHGRNAAISETHILSERNINQFTAGFSRIFNHILSFGNGTCAAAKLGIQGADLNSKCPGAPAGVVDQAIKDCMSCGLTSTELTGYWSLGDRGFAPDTGGTNVFSISDSFDMIRGNHNIRVGGGFRANQMNVETNAFQDGFFLFFGTWTGDPAADLLLGQPGGAIHDQTFAGATTGRRWKLFRPFVQDDWRVTNNLTLNLGVAWALVTPITEARNRQSNFDFATGKLLVAGPASEIAGCTICTSSDGRVGIKMDKSAVEPRIGLSWKPFGKQNTAIRLGYAIFHDSSWNQGDQGLWENPPYLAESDSFPAFGAPVCPYNNANTTQLNCGVQSIFLPALTAPEFPPNFPGTVQSQNLNFRQGQVQQFNANVEHQLPGNIVLTVGYAGSRSHHILVDGMNLNITNPLACLPQTHDFNGNVIPNTLYDPNYHVGCSPNNVNEIYPNAPYPSLGVVSNNNDAGTAHYNSLQIKAETKSARHGLYALLGYTYSKTYDSGYSDGLGTNLGPTYWPLPGSQKLDWGLSQINVDQQFTASVTYALPFGKGKRFGSNWSGALDGVLGNWEADVIERVLSGFPVFVFDSNNGSGVNFQQNATSNNRPNQTCSPTSNHPTILKWFNTDCFTAPDDGKLGNASRAPLSGPGFVNTDFSLIKHLPLHEGIRMDFRAEFFNLFNHTQYATPNGDLNAGSQFGQINSTVNNPRLVQFALKLNF
jgi:Carboxypeptidase regulatory-like domain/TonB-dependent Receptor Plug Domain